MHQLIWADGGLSNCAPRDTLVAYWGALGAGADGLIVGAQLTTDGVVICSATDSLEATTGKASRVSELTAAEVRKLDAGATFQSMVLDHNNKETSTKGEDKPWVQNTPQDSLYHPTLEEVSRLLGRRTRLLITLGSAGEAASKEQVEATLAVLNRFALTRRTVIAGNAETLKHVGTQAEKFLMPDAGSSSEDAAKEAQRLGASMAMVSADRAVGFQGGPALLLVTPTAGHRAPSPEEYAALAESPGVAGYELMHSRGLIAADDFAGTKINNDLWVLGHSRPNDEASIEVNDGLHIKIEGKEYSGAAAFTAFSIHGGFDARMSFEVANPNQGTTFELAALHIDAGYQQPNLTFDVHGAPPYASSERDEDDGFRIGWNNGPALIFFVVEDVTKPQKAVPQSSNLYNNYGRDVGYAKKDSPTGELRLTRNGYIYNSYYRDKFNQAWVLSGSVAVPALAEAVFLRLGAKHWPKKGKTAPNNQFKFSRFELFQW
jgi:Glycerophosphoryl diester phosphodiesterase family